jgi:hypothetical protein
MIRKNIAILVLIPLILYPTNVFSGNLFKAVKMVCRYCSGTSVNWYKQAPEALIVKKEFVDQMCPSVIFANIDLDKDTALSKEGNFETATEVWESSEGLTFLGMSYGSGVTVTTVFDAKATEPELFLSVRSEHTTSSNFPLPKQFFGACEVVE